MGTVRKILFLGNIFMCALFANCYYKKINVVRFVAFRGADNQTHILPVIYVISNYLALLPFLFICDLVSPTITFNSQRYWFGEIEKGLIQCAYEFNKK